MDEITAEYAADQLAAPVALRAVARVRIAAKTDLGRVRENNEDKYEFYIPDEEALLATRGQVFVVCDGMGGHAAGQIASELAAKTFIDVYLHHPSEDPALALRAGVQAADRFVTDVGRTIPGRRGMGTTLSSLVLLQEAGLIAHVGDSRVYRLRGGDLELLTTDHTWVEQAVQQGVISPEEAKTHLHRHVLLRAIGAEDFVVEPDVFPIDVQAGDVFLLCSDGVMNHVEDDQIEEILLANGPSEAAWKIVGAALQARTAR